MVNNAMHPMILSLITVAGAEIGDKTQLLAIILSTRYKRPNIIILGIIIATLLNHTLTAFLGGWLSTTVSPFYLKIIIALSFFTAAVWSLIPAASTSEPAVSENYLLITTIVCFSLAELGDKTQLVTAVIAAQYHAVTSVVIGSTVGMLVANIPAIYLSRYASMFTNNTYTRLLLFIFLCCLGLMDLFGITDYF